MDWSKRNPLLGGVLLVCALLLAAEVWLWRSAREQAARALAALEQKKQERSSLAAQSPALSAATEQAIGQDLDQAAKVLAGLRAALQPREGKAPAGPAPAESIDAYFDVAAFVEKTRALAARAQVVLRPEECFGFSTHTNEGPEKELVPAVHRQRQAAHYLLEALLEARPQALLGVQRERPMTEAQRARRNLPGAPAAKAAANTGGQATDFFEVDALSSLRLPGRIECEAFRLEFTGQTPALRAFLNSLAAGPRPVVVRRVEVERLTAEAPSTANLPAGAPVPLVAQNLSRFAVVVECVELLPAPERSTP
ncbi:MAG: hypothetical protein HYX71_09040 [Opitutae bacterium]|nr:hypothetical protein [Opitutae bacterium]